ncbi:MAG: hypothetical protein AB1689_24920, partial [Thermodesulfobacteriota bacterium]
ALPLLPMLAALREPLPAAPPGGAVPGPWQHRVGDLLLLVPRVLDGLTLPGRPRAVDAWLTVEGGATALATAAACWALLRPPRPDRAAATRFTALVFLGCFAAVALLPAEAWYYYLDTTLAPGAVLIGVAWHALWRRRLARWLLGGVVVARTAVLLWWILSAAASGFVPANLDLLRLGGPRAASPDARARLPSVATKREVARILAGELAIPLDRLWRDVHGSGFSDVDTDNGFFLRRAAAEARALPDRGMSALVSYRGDFPDDWLAGMGPPRLAGPLVVRGYRAAIGAREARVTGCGPGAIPLPEPAPPAPLAYGAGELTRPTWPCAEPSVAVPVAAAAPATVLRVFARADGAARVLGIDSEPPGAPLASGAPGTGPGVELPPDPAQVVTRLAVDGPARLDLVELHGVR